MENQPLHSGLRNIAVKDNIATLGSRTTCGSGILREHQSPFEASVVRSLRIHGTSVSGKTNLDEFGMGSHSTHSFFGTVHNALPFENLSPGGSSGGSAVAIASGQCSVALGTDTGGSVRLPAAYTGLFGFKPSYGVISRWGVVPYANSMDTVGIIASNVIAIRKALFRVRQYDPKDPTSLSDRTWKRLDNRRKSAEKREATARAESGDEKRSITEEQNIDMFGVRIGVPLEYNIAELEPGIRQAWSDCLMSLQARGATIVPVSLPNTKHALSAYYILAPAEAASNLAKYDGVRYGNRDGLADGIDGVLYSRTRGNGFGDEVKRRILLGSYTLSSEAVDNYFLKAQKVRRLVQRDFDRIFAIPNPLRPAQQFDLGDIDESILMSNKLGPTQVDYIICPTAPTLPPTLEDLSKQTPVDNYMNDVFTVPASLAGIPAISIPFPIPETFCVEGKPTFAGMQIIGQYASDYELIKIAEVLVKNRTPTESITPIPKTATELGKFSAVWNGPANMTRLIERYVLKREIINHDTKKLTRSYSTLKIHEQVTKKSGDQVLEDGLPPLRKIKTARGHDPEALGGGPIIWKLSELRARALAWWKNNLGKLPISKIDSQSAVQTPASDNLPNVPNVRIRKIFNSPDPAPEIKPSKLLIRKIPIVSNVPICKTFNNPDPAPEIEPSNFVIRKYPSVPNVRIRKTTRGEFYRRPHTDKEANKVFEDTLGLWVEQHQN